MIQISVVQLKLTDDNWPKVKRLQLCYDVLWPDIVRSDVLGHF